MITRRQMLAASAGSLLNAASDKYRPRYHFTPPQNWMNDPNGLIDWNGSYHLFYQHNPNTAYWGDMHWGHATSPDLVHWKHEPIAMVPTPGGPDKDGVFSGCAIVADGVPTFLYTGVKPEVQCLASSRDNLRTIEKFRGNPVISGPPRGLDVTAFRDPCVWKENGAWMMALGSGIKDGGGMALLYESPDLKKWTYLHPLAQGDREKTSPTWECPNFFPLRDKHVLIVSADPWRKCLYFTGKYKKQRFKIEHQGDLDNGGSYYAPQTMLDRDGRRVIFGWLQETRSKEAQVRDGWSGAQTLPRVLTLRDDNTLGYEPHPAVAQLRGEHDQRQDSELLAGRPLALEPGDYLELDIQISPHSAQQIGVRFRMSPDRREQTTVAFDRDTRLLTLDRTRSSLSADVTRDKSTITLPLSMSEQLGLRVFLDNSVVEIFANGLACLSSRIYPTLPDSRHIEVFAEGGSAKIRSIDRWEMGMAF